MDLVSRLAGFDCMVKCLSEDYFVLFKYAYVAFGSSMVKSRAFIFQLSPLIPA